MPLSSSIDERGFTRLTLEGPWPPVNEIVQLYRSLGDMTAIRRLLLDIQGATGPLPRFPEVREIVGSFNTDSPDVRSRRRAVLVASDVQFGIARTFQAIVPGDMEVFRDEASAVAWLLAGAG
jgi:hypothetical protein